MIYLNNVLITPTLFPDNTSQVWKIPEDVLNLKGNAVSIDWIFSHEGEFLHLAQLTHLVKQYTNLAADITLYLKYLPYGRQDKLVSNNSTFALQTFATLINTLGFKSVVIQDPHSQEALDLIFRSRAIYPKEQIQKVMEITKSDIVCYPDKGAVSKYTKIYDYPYIYGEKVRDQLTGNITNYRLLTDTYMAPFGHNVLIIDDICDGGMTFKILAKDLLAAGTKEVNLFVTHGIFSKGLKTLKDSGISNVFTSDGEVGEYQNNITYRRL